MSTLRALRTALPEPGNGWVRYYWAPRDWVPSTDRSWLNLVSGQLHFADDEPPAAPAVPQLRDVKALDDTVYVPPLGARSGSGTESGQDPRTVLMADLVASGVPHTVQWLPGQELAEWEPSRLDLLDLTECTVLPVGYTEEQERNAFGERLAELWQGLSRPVWFLVPLIAGVTEPHVEWIAKQVHQGLQTLRGEQPNPTLSHGGLLWVVPELSAGDRRRLASPTGDQAKNAAALELSQAASARFDMLFHGSEASLTLATQCTANSGIATLPPRPLSSHSGRLRRRREAAGLLLGVAEHLRLAERPENECQDLVRAGLWIDRNDQDPLALVREGNVRVINEVRPAQCLLLEQWANHRSDTAVELAQAFLQQVREP